MSLTLAFYLVTGVCLHFLYKLWKFSSVDFICNLISYSAINFFLYFHCAEREAPAIHLRGNFTDQPSQNIKANQDPSSWCTRHE